MLFAGDRRPSMVEASYGSGMSTGKRLIDVIVWGATGFTGGLVAENMIRQYGVGQSLAWGIGGRNRAKLEAVRARLQEIDPRAGDIPIFVGGSTDRASLDTLARTAKVVASTVGPYAVHGGELVAACAEAGTDYCDITGETPFMRAMIDRHHARARETGARIVHACGFDSIPADLGTLLVQNYARERHGSRCTVVKYLLGPMKGSFSGGTLASLMQLADDRSRDPNVRRLLDDPYALDPDHTAVGAEARNHAGLHAAEARPGRGGVVWDEDIGRWTGPYPFAVVDTGVVYRTNALLGYSWGRDFRLREAVSFAPGPGGLAMAAGVSAAVAMGFAAVEVGVLRKVIAEHLMPAPGEGPSQAARTQGFFVARIVGSTEGGSKVFGLIRGTSDPGYGETAKMLTESAVSLAKDGRMGLEGGVLTPASCMGMRLVERLRDVGMRFEVADTPLGS
jgi:short subunit dehydrogenase-like uncharacterized protein